VFLRKTVAALFGGARPWTECDFLLTLQQQCDRSVGRGVSGVRELVAARSVSAMAPWESKMATACRIVLV
jgi:hypothetical protein